MFLFRTSVTAGFLCVALMLGTASLCSAASITYGINLTIGAGSASGNIITDGLIGTLATTDILGVNLLLNDGTGPPVGFFAPPFNLPFDAVLGSDLSATQTQLLFNFSGTDHGFFNLEDASLDFGLCFGTTGTCGYAGAPPGPLEVVHYTKIPEFVPDNQFMSQSGTQVIASTTPSAVPEPSNLARLGAGIALLGFYKKTGSR